MNDRWWRIVRIAFFELVILLLVAVLGTMAQAPAPIVDISLKYAVARTDLAAAGGSNEHLFGTSVAVRVNSWAHGRADWLRFGGTPEAHVALFGLEARRSLKGILPPSDVFKPEAFEVFGVVQGGFARAIVAGAKADNDFAASVGGGLDFTATRTDGVVVLRVFEVRYLRANLFDNGRFFKNNALVEAGIKINIDRLF